METAELAELLREAEEHHGTYDATVPEHHWSSWYAAYMIARTQGRPSDRAAEDAGRHVAQDLARQATGA